MSIKFTQRILIVNDDGINAQGIKALEEVALQLSDDVWVVAPEQEQSGQGHAVTLASPLMYRKVSEKHFAVSGTPTDCVVIALHQIMKDQKPTLILSGFNHGVNLAEDLTYSGTASIAMEGSICNIPSIALSQQLDNATKDSDFSVVKKHAVAVIESLILADWPDNLFYNVNFPATEFDVKGVRLTRQGIRKASEFFVEERKNLRDKEYYWLSFNRSYDTDVKNSDLAGIKERYITVTPLLLDLTDEKIMGHLGTDLDKDF